MFVDKGPAKSSIEEVGISGGMVCYVFSTVNIHCEIGVKCMPKSLLGNRQVGSLYVCNQ